MKKVLMISAMILILTFMGNSHVKVSGIKLKDYPKSATIWGMLELKAERELGELIMLPHSSFNQKEAAGIISRLDQLPASLLKKTNDAGIIVKLFTGKLTENPSASHLRGTMPRGYTTTIWDDVPGMGGSKIVLIKIGASQKGNGHGSVNLELHELAHSIDRYCLQELRHHPQFIHIWQQEKEHLFAEQPYFLTYPEEYFAECFAYYYMGGAFKKELQQKAPLTYQLIKSIS